MKRGNISLINVFLLICALGFTMSSCSDYDYDEDGGGDGRVLDSNLYGTWTHGAEDNKSSYTFKSNGECIQTTYGTDYDWLWEIEDGQLKLYVTNGTPAYMTYKIEGDKLYFWSDYIDGWALPFTKE